MPLNESQMEQINKGLQSLLSKGLRGCSVCGSQDIVGGDVIAYPTVSRGTPINNIRVEVGCNNCGHVMLFSAQKLGLS